jgi:HPt (histidine-containing phosphotransfer) domain-containing protein
VHSAAFDGDPLLELFNGDRTAVDELLITALTSVCVDVRRLELALATDDATALVEAAHHLRGTSGSLGATKLAEASRAVEAHANLGLATSARSLIDDVLRESNVLKIDIGMFRRSLQSQAGSEHRSA